MSFRDRVRAGAVAATIAAAGIPTPGGAIVGRQDVNNFNPSIPTISLKELESRMKIFIAQDDKFTPPTIAAAGTGANTNIGSQQLPAIDPELRQRLAAGDVSAMREYGAMIQKEHMPALSANNSGLSNATRTIKPGAAQSEEGSNTNNPLQDRLAGALSLSLNPAPRIAMMETGSSKAQASFPLSMDDAKKAIELFRSSKVVSVTINTGQEGGPVNVVQDYGPYKSSIKPFDQVTKFEGRKLEASKEHYEMSDRPTGTVTKAWNDMPARPGLPEPQR